jgi:thiopeptide-type bacteriocin biosynthesis protein
MSTSPDPTLGELARRVADRLASHDPSCLPVGRTIDELADLFTQGGMATLELARSANHWVQRAIQPIPGAESHQRLMSAISTLATELLNSEVAHNFFFMHKPPGLRLRFQSSAEPAALRERLTREAVDWQTRGLIRAHGPAVYEPECRLFGGAQSMEYVHVLFTIDSLFWAAYHARSRRTAQTPTGAWTASLRLLRSAFDGLGILGWEDLGVWDTVLDDTGRRLNLDLAATQGYGELAALMRRAWAHTARGQLGEAEQDPQLQACAELVRAQAVRWKSGYFESPDARIGPRRAAAYLTIFHWNRAGFSPTQQGLVAEALASRCEHVDA